MMITAAGSADEPSSCPTCGAALRDPARHAAWHRGEPPATETGCSVEASELIDEILFALRRNRRGGIL